MIRRAFGAIGAMLAAVTMLVISAGPASAHYLDGTDPASTGCVNGSYAIHSANIYNSAGAYIGQMDVRYSPSCGTNWVRLYNTVPGAIAEKLISVDNGWLDDTMDVATGWSYGMQAYAPGSTCIEVLALIRVGTTRLGEHRARIC